MNCWGKKGETENREEGSLGEQKKWEQKRPNENKQKWGPKKHSEVEVSSNAKIILSSPQDEDKLQLDIAME